MVTAERTAGRPPEGPGGEARTIELRVRLAPAERAAVEASAARARVTVSRWVRERLSTPHDVTARDVASWLREAQHDDTTGDEAAALGAAAEVVEEWIR